MPRLRSARPASSWLLVVALVSLIVSLVEASEEVQEAAESSSSSQMSLVKPPNFAQQAEKLHKFAYDISLSKRIREQQKSAAKERERRKNDKLIKTNQGISTTYSQHKQQIPTKNKHQKRTTKVPSLFFDDDADIEQEQQQQQTTTTVATDNLLVVYDKSPSPMKQYLDSNSTNDYNNNNLLVTATEKYQPQVQTTLTSYHSAIDEGEAPPSYTIVPPPREQSYTDTDARVRETNSFLGDDQPPHARLKPILLTSGIKVRSELSFAPDAPDTRPQQETRNLAGSVVYNDVASSTTTTTSEDAKRSKLRRTTEMAPTRLVFGLDDENLPPELSLRHPQQAAHNRIGSQAKRQGEDLDDSEDDYPHAQDDWLPPYKRTSSSSSSQVVKTSGVGTKTAALAQTSSSAIRVVASDDSVPLVINNRGLITAAKSSLRNKWKPQVTTPRPLLAMRPASNLLLHVPRPAPIKRPPIATITEAPAQLFLSTNNNGSSSSSIIEDLAQPPPPTTTTIAANATTEQSWSSFLPNPPYKHLNFTQTTPAATTTTTMRPTIERRSTSTTTKRPQWLVDLSSASSHQQHVTSAGGGGDTLTTTASYSGEPAAADIRPALNNQSSLSNLKKPAQSYLRHKLQSILRQKLISSNKKQAALAGASNSTTTAGQANAIKLQMLATPPPLLSSTVANNVASLLTQTLGSLIMRQQQQQQQQPPTAPTILQRPQTQRPVNKIRQRLGQVTKANAILNRRATSVGSLLFSGFIYGLSVLPALMAITGINPLGGSAETTQSPSRNSRKQSSGNANQRKQAGDSSAASSKIMLANLPPAFPYMLPPVPFPPASLFAAPQPQQSDLSLGSDQFHSPQDSGIDPHSTADALLQPTVHSADYPAQQMGGSFSDLQPLIDEPTTTSRYHKQQSDDLDQWHQSAGAQESSRRKVQRDLRNWHQSNHHHQQDYDSFQHQQQQQSRPNYPQDKASNTYRRPTSAMDSHDASSSDRQAAVNRPMPVGSSQQQQQQDEMPTSRPMPMSQSNSQVAATQFPAAAAASASDRPTGHNTYLTAASYGSSGSQAAAAAAAAAAVAAATQANQMSDSKYVSPVAQSSSASQPSIPAPSWSPERGDNNNNNNRIDTRQQARPIGSQQQIHGQQRAQQQWQEHHGTNNFLTTSASLPSAQSAGSSSIDFALLGPYEPIVAFQPAPQNGPVDGGQQDTVPLRPRRTPSRSNPSLAGGGGDDGGQRFAKILQHPVDAKPVAATPWSSSGSRVADGASQWRAITQPVTRSDSSKVILVRKGAKKHKRRHQGDKRKQFSNRLGAPQPAVGSSGPLGQPSQLSDGQQVVLTRSVALSER